MWYVCTNYSPPPTKVTKETVVAGFDELTTRQRTVIGLVAQDMTSQEIATKLGISANTVDCHRKNALRCLGARGKAGMRRALRLLERVLRPEEPPA